MRRRKFRGLGGPRVYKGAIRGRQNGNPGLRQLLSYERRRLSSFRLGNQIEGSALILAPPPPPIGQLLLPPLDLCGGHSLRRVRTGVLSQDPDRRDHSTDSQHEHPTHKRFIACLPLTCRTGTIVLFTAILLSVHYPVNSACTTLAIPRSHTAPVSIAPRGHFCGQCPLPPIGYNQPTLGTDHWIGGIVMSLGSSQRVVGALLLVVAGSVGWYALPLAQGGSAGPRIPGRSLLAQATAHHQGFGRPLAPVGDRDGRSQLHRLPRSHHHGESGLPQKRSVAARGRPVDSRTAGDSLRVVRGTSSTAGAIRH